MRHFSETQLDGLDKLRHQILVTGTGLVPEMAILNRLTWLVAW